MLALRLALRELRGGVRGLRIVLACLALGIGVIAAVGSLRAGLDRGLAADGRGLLGGDLAVETGGQPLSPKTAQWLADRGARLSQIVQMRSMLVAPSGERQLVQLKAVDSLWPMVGEAAYAPAQTTSAALAGGSGHPGLVAEQAILDRLGVKPGDAVRVGTATFTVSGALTNEPDRVAGTVELAPRALISLDALPATGLVVPGSMIQYATRVLMPQGTDLVALARDLAAFAAGEGLRIRNARDAAPGLTRFLDQTALFMTLVGLTALLVGGIGASTGVRAWLEARGRTIATLRCLGASSRMVLAVFLIQVAVLAVAGVIIGLLAGALVPLAVAAFLRDLLPVAPVAGIYPLPLALAALFGLLTAASFVLWPLGRAARVPGAALFRDATLSEGGRPETWLIALNAVIALLLVAFTVAVSTDKLFALWFCSAAVITLLLFRLGALGLMALARRAPAMRAPWARLGLANLHRPGAATPIMLVSVGLGLSTLAAVALIEGNIRRQIADQLPANAPSFFFVDIQNDQLPQFESLARTQPGVSEFRQVPSLRTRIVAIKGVPVELAQVSPSTRFALQGDRGLTYSATIPPGSRLVAGEWWPADYEGKPLASIDQDIARGWGLSIGDTLRVNVLGRDIDLTIANFRDIAWRSMSINFFIVVSPGLLEHAPQTHIATVRAEPAAQGPFLRAVTDALPNVTGILVADVIKTVAALLDKIATALAVTGSVTLVSGALVLAGAVAAGQRRRTQEAVILRSLGATRSQIRAAWIVEFGVLGIAAGVIAAMVGTLASYGVLRFVMQAEWVFLPGRLAVTLLTCVALMLVFGYAGTAGALRARPVLWLRNE